MAQPDYSGTTKQQLAELFSRSLYTIDGLWFLALEEKYGLDTAVELDVAVWRRFSLIHARRALKTLAIKEDSPVKTFIRLLEEDPVLTIFKTEIVELSDKKAVFRYTECPPQRARIRDSRGEYPCKAVGLTLFSSYAEVIDPGLKLSCLFCPPDTHPQETWCKWQIEI
ncbi:DUF6125 family protein [Chloroflexota bacterium]